MMTLIHGGRKVAMSEASWPVAHLVMVMIVTVTLLMGAHFAEIAVWSLAYGLAGVAPDNADLFYFAFVNYTTLGYGDVLPSEDWRLIGPITAMNGVLMFGWSTAVIFEVLLTTVQSIRRS
jgi:hypothetical protein